MEITKEIESIKSFYEKEYSCLFELFLNKENSIIYVSDSKVLKVSKKSLYSTDFRQRIRDFSSICERKKSKYYIENHVDENGEFYIQVSDKVNCLFNFNSNGRYRQDTDGTSYISKLHNFYCEEFNTIKEIVLDMWNSGFIHNDILNNIAYKEEGDICLIDQESIIYTDYCGYKTSEEYIEFLETKIISILYKDFIGRMTLVLYDGICGSTNLLSIINHISGDYKFLHNFIGSDKNDGDKITQEFILSNFDIKTDFYKKCGFKYRYTGHPYLNKDIDKIIQMFNKVILITRDNKKDLICSYAIKQKTNQPNCKSHESIKQVDSFYCDIKELISVLKHKKEAYSYCLSKLEDTRKKLIVSYETLFTDETISSILHFIGDYHGDKLETLTEKGDYKKVNSKERYKQLILNLDELIEAVERFENETL